MTKQLHLSDTELETLREIAEKSQLVSVKMDTGMMSLGFRGRIRMLDGGVFPGIAISLPETPKQFVCVVEMPAILQVTPQTIDRVGCTILASIRILPHI